MNDNKKEIREYFSNVSNKLLFDAKTAQSHHPTLTGQHREEVLKNYLSDILPKKYSVGNGLIYGSGVQINYKSKEADIIIWDSFEHPEIKLRGYSLYFAESTKVVIEVKSTWSENEFEDIKSKTQLLKSYVIPVNPSINDKIWILNNQLAAIASGKSCPAMISEAPRIGVVSICYNGGNSLTKANIDKKQLGNIENSWPDAMLFLDIGKVIYKEYVQSEGITIKGNLKIIDAGQHALLLFTEFIFQLLLERSTGTESQSSFFDFLENLLPTFNTEEIEFPVRKLTPGMQILK